MRSLLALMVAVLLVAGGAYSFSGIAVPDVFREVPTETVVVADENCLVVDLDNRKHRHVLDHAWDAIDKGQPRRLHVDRTDADENREESLRGIPSKPDEDRDEYPPAVSEEGGEGASVRYVDDSENQSAGSVMGNQIGDLADGDCFQYEPRP